MKHSVLQTIKNSEYHESDYRHYYAELETKVIKHRIRNNNAIHTLIWRGIVIL